MKRAPKELLDAVKEIAKASAPTIRIRGRLLDLLEDWQPVDHYNAAYFTEDGVGSAVEILRKDVAEWKAKAEKAEREAKDAYHRGYRQGEQDTAQDGANGRYFGQYNG
jgi:hypothetical protein